ncbi:hypothetical protein Efla_002399 [Eimeria flavescens]
MQSASLNREAAGDSLRRVAAASSELLPAASASQLSPQGIAAEQPAAAAADGGEAAYLLSSKLHAGEGSTQLAPALSRLASAADSSRRDGLRMLLLRSRAPWLQQVTLQLLLLLASWASLALCQTALPPFLLLVAISLTRLHLGWLLLCLPSLLLRGSSKNPPTATAAAGEGPNEAEETSLAAGLRVLRELGWNRLPLRYWRCVFYLTLLLAAFWAFSVVREESLEGLQTLQGGGEAPLFASHGWRGGSLPPLLLNADSPQHVKLVATAVARGREASSQLAWLLHAATRKQYGRLILWLRLLASWADSALLQPLLALLRRLNLLDSLNATCSAAEGPPPHSPADQRSDSEGWAWVLWFQSAVQSAVHSLPSAAQRFLCGGGSSSSSGVYEWSEGSSSGHDKPALEFGEEGAVLETGPYFVALLLLLVYSLSSLLQRLCLVLPRTLWRLSAASGVFLSGLVSSYWRQAFALAGSSAATSFAVTLVLLVLLYALAAAAAKACALLASLVRAVGFDREAASSTSTSSSKSLSSSSSSNSSNRSRSKSVSSSSSSSSTARGSVCLEILAAAVTCWLLLLADRNFVIFMWASLQPLRLFLLSTLVLLRLPSGQVAALLSWPPPLREPALQLQRSQPLRIIDPVAVGSMLGCLFAAAVLPPLWRAVSVAAALLKSLLLPLASAAEDTSGGGLVRTRGGLWLPGRSVAARDGSPSSVWQQLQLQSQRIAELQKRLSEEQRKAALTDELTVRLRSELQKQAAAAHRECLTSSQLQQQQEELQEDFVFISSAADEAVTGHQRLQEELARQHEAWRKEAEEALAEKQQQLQLLQTRFAEHELDLQHRLEASQLQVRELQRELLAVKTQAADERCSHLQKQSELEDELARCQQRLGLLMAAESRWKENKMATGAQLDRLQRELRAAGEQRKEALASQTSAERQLADARQRYNELKGMTMLTVKRQSDDLAAKTAEINELRKDLLEALSRYEEVAALLRSTKTQQALGEVGQLTEAAVDQSRDFAARKPHHSSASQSASGGSSVSEGAAAGPVSSSSWASQQANSSAFAQPEALVHLANVESSLSAVHKVNEGKETSSIAADIRCSDCGKKLFEEGSQEDIRPGSEALALLDQSAREMVELLDKHEQECQKELHLHHLKPTTQSPSSNEVARAAHHTACNTSDSDDNTHRQSPEPSQTALEGDQLLLDAPTSPEISSPKRKPVSGTREILSKEERARLEQALRKMKCIYPLEGLLEKFELPEPVIRATVELAAASGFPDADVADLKKSLAPLRRCSWEEAFSSLDQRLEALEVAWPSEASCRALLHRAGEAHTMPPLEQKASFLPFTRISQGRQRVALLRAVLHLDPQLQEERGRLDRLKAALECLRDSLTLRLLCTSCVEVYAEMRSASPAGKLPENPASTGGVKHEDSTQQMPSLGGSSMWETAEELRAALQQFRVWEENGDFSFRCFDRASHIHPLRLNGFSLLHVILIRAHRALQQNDQLVQQRDEKGDQVDAPRGNPQEQKTGRQSLPEKLAEELNVESSSGESATERSSSPAEQSSSRCSESFRCACAVCSTLGAVSSGRLREWVNVRMKMMEQLVFKTSPGRSHDPPGRGAPTPSVQGEGDAKRDENDWPRERTDGIFAILRLYCDVLSREQTAVADLGKRIQEQLKKLPRPREPQFDGACTSTLSGSPSLKSRSASSPEAEQPSGRLPHAKPPAPPAAEAASRPGHIPNETERGLDAALQLLKTVHASLALIGRAWTELVNDRRSLGYLAYDQPEMWQDETVTLVSQRCASADSEAAAKSAILANAASIAATAALRAEGVLKSTTVMCRNDSGFSKRPMPKQQQQRQQQQRADGSLAMNASSSGIPCVNPLQVRQGSEAASTDSNPQGQPTRLAYGKPAKRSVRSAGNSTNPSPVIGSKDSRRWHTKTEVTSYLGSQPAFTVSAQAKGRVVHSVRQPAAGSMRLAVKNLSQAVTAAAAATKKTAARQRPGPACEAEGAGGQGRSGSFKACEPVAEQSSMKYLSSISGARAEAFDAKAMADLSATDYQALSLSDAVRIRTAVLQIANSDELPLKEGDRQLFLLHSPPSEAEASGLNLLPHADSSIPAEDGGPQIEPPPDSPLLADALTEEDDPLIAVARTKKGE